MSDKSLPDVPRVIDIVPLFCPYCPKRVGAVSHGDFEKMREAGIKVYCDPCRRALEAAEYAGWRKP